MHWLGSRFLIVGFYHLRETFDSTRQNLIPTLVIVRRAPNPKHLFPRGVEEPIGKDLLDSSLRTVIRLGWKHFVRP